MDDIKIADDLVKALVGNDDFKKTIGTTMGDSFKELMEKAQKPDEAASPLQKLFAPSVQTKGKKRDPESHLGAYVAVMAKAKGIKPLAAHYAQELYGEDHGVTKALTSTGVTSGDEFVQDSVAAEVIEALRPASVIRALGPRMVQNPTGQITIPRFDAGAAITWGQEATATNATQQVTGGVTLNWKKGIIKVPVTKELMLHSSPDIESAVAADVVAAMAQGTDAAYIRGASGGNNPVGIRNQMAAGNVLVAAQPVNATNVEDDLRRLMQAVLGNNRTVNSETGAWLMSVRSFLFLLNLRDANGNLIFPELRAAQPRMYTYRVSVTNNIPDNLTDSGGSPDEGSEVYFGHVPSLFLTDATGLALEVLENATFTDSGGSLRSGVDTDEVLVKAVIRTDIALRHDISWAVLTQVMWGA